MLINGHAMTDFTDDQWKWLQDFDMTPGAVGNTTDDQSQQWHENTASNQDCPWERSLAEEAIDMTSFLKKLAAEVDNNKKM